jgi:predicted permease
MPVISIIFGVLLIALGVWGYSASELEGALKYTALIPSGFGLALAVCGAVALKESLLKHAMHAAAAVGLIGFLLAAGRFVPKAVREGIDTSKIATLATGGMMVLCLVFVALCVNSFIQARRRKAAAQAAGAPQA